MEKELFAKGKRGLIHLAEYKGKRIVVKSKRPEATTDRLALEATFLQKLNKKGIGPQFLFFHDGELGMEFIEGELIEDYAASQGRKEILRVLVSVLDQMKVMDDLGMNKREMHRPVKHIIVRRGKPVLIDFERCYYTEKPQNVSQFIQYLTSTRLGALLTEKGIHFPKMTLRELSARYKEDHSSFKKIRKLLVDVGQ